MSPAQAALVGVAFLALDPKDWLTKLAAVDLIAAADLSGMASLVAYLIFTLLAQSVLLIPLMLVLAIALGGCATKGDLEEVQAREKAMAAKADQAAQDAEAAKQAADEAITKADEAVARAEEAERRAEEAEKRAEERERIAAEKERIAEEKAQKADEMFQKSMKK